ncbi:hypothetical protein ACIPSE_45225 [Streptomyces sp. NPDC090106]|uniref:hypothetical protein n=1 Tax=Streptomyces sp. NPDC090106 TaxID=3365946 RepID=UPI0038205B02
MAKDSEERTPQEWRDILASYQYPDEIGKISRRRGQRREAKREHRHQVREDAKEWVREQRRREPIRPTVALIIVAVFLGAGVVTKYVWPSLLGGSTNEGTHVTATATAAPSGYDGKPAASPVPTSATPSSSPSTTVDLGDPDHVAEEAVRLYLTRNPPQDKDHAASIRRAAPYLTPALTNNLASQEDPSWGKLVSRGGVATVRTAKAGPAGDDLPIDTPLRVWRTVTTKVDIEGYTDYSETHELNLELTTTEDGWRVSRILGL